jgi:TadE-like protein
MNSRYINRRDTIAAVVGPTATRPNVERGSAMFETLIAAPIVLLLGLSVLQWALVFHARTAVSYALQEAARAGSVANAETPAIESGLARGLVPYLIGAPDAAGYAASLVKSVAHVAAGRAGGWIVLNRIAPTRQSFEDWAEPGRDDDGNILAGEREIPNDNLTFRIATKQPATGVAGFRGDEPIGIASGQTLSDANLLKIELIYGVPMSVPLVGRIAIWMMKIIDGCQKPGARHLGLIDLGTPVPTPRTWTCPFYDALDEVGRQSPRWPVKLSATVRMQSPARSAGEAIHRQVALLGPSQGFGQIDAENQFASMPEKPGSTAASNQVDDPLAARDAGFLQLGGSREVFNLGACAAN